MRRVCKLNQGPITDESLRAIYREIMSSALSLEKTMTIAYLGPEATFTHQAAIQKFGASLHYAAQKTIADVFAEVSKNRADYGVVPVENSTEGVVTPHAGHVRGERSEDCRADRPAHPLLPGGRTRRARTCSGSTSIRRPWPNAASGCSAICPGRKSWKPPPTRARRNWPPSPGTEHAARRVRTAAITGVLAADKYGLKIIEHNLQDFTGNATRFLVLGRQCSPPSGHDRTSLMLSIADRSRRAPQRPGALPPLPAEHDQDRIAPQQAQGLGVFLLC